MSRYSFQRIASLCLFIFTIAATPAPQAIGVSKTPLFYRVTIVAGTAAVGFSGDGGPAVDAKLNHPSAVAIDAFGNLYIADYFNARIRRVDRNGIISTIAGNGTPGFSGDHGPATGASLGPAYGVSVGASGAVYIADSVNNRIRMVSPSGEITTIAGTGDAGHTGDGGPATSATLTNPDDVIEGPDGILFVADTGNNRIRRIARTGTITTIAGNGRLLYNGRARFDAKIGPALNTALSSPSELAFRSDGSLCFVDFGFASIRCIDNTATLSMVAGTGQEGYNGDFIPAREARLNSPGGLAFDAAGNLLVTDGGNFRIRRIRAGGVIETIAGTGNQSTKMGLAALPSDLAALSTPVGFLDKIVAGPNGTFYIADFGGNVVRKLEPMDTNGSNVSPPVSRADIFSILNTGYRHLVSLSAHVTSTRWRGGRPTRREGTITMEPSRELNLMFQDSADGTVRVHSDGLVLTVTGSAIRGSIRIDANKQNCYAYLIGGITTTALCALSAVSSDASNDFLSGSVAVHDEVTGGRQGIEVVEDDHDSQIESRYHIYDGIIVAQTNSSLSSGARLSEYRLSAIKATYL